MAYHTLATRSDQPYGGDAGGASPEVGDRFKDQNELDHEILRYLVSGIAITGQPRLPTNITKGHTSVAVHRGIFAKEMFVFFRSI